MAVATAGQRHGSEDLMGSATGGEGRGDGGHQGGSRAPGVCAVLLNTGHRGGHTEVTVARHSGINPLCPDSCKQLGSYGFCNTVSPAVVVV